MNMRLPWGRDSLVRDLPAAPPIEALPVEERRRFAAVISNALGGVDPRAFAAIGRLIDVAGVDFALEVLSRTLEAPEDPRCIHACGGRLKIYLRIAQRNLSHDAWLAISPRMAFVPERAHDARRRERHSWGRRAPR